jgi:hypothetical protein
MRSALRGASARSFGVTSRPFPPTSPVTQPRNRPAGVGVLKNLVRSSCFRAPTVPAVHPELPGKQRSGGVAFIPAAPHAQELRHRNRPPEKCNPLRPATRRPSSWFLVLRFSVAKWYVQSDRTPTDLAQFRGARRTVKSQDVTAEEGNRPTRGQESAVQSWGILGFVSRYRGKCISVVPEN